MSLGLRAQMGKRQEQPLAQGLRHTHGARQGCCWSSVAVPPPANVIGPRQGITPKTLGTKP